MLGHNNDYKSTTAKLDLFHQTLFLHERVWGLGMTVDHIVCLLISLQVVTSYEHLGVPLCSVKL